MPGTVIKSWRFPSKSKPDAKPYETLEYDDGNLSCNCPGWTRQCRGGTRTCAHVRSIQSGMAEIDCVSSHDYRAGAIPKKQPFITPEKKEKKEKESEDKKPLSMHRKIAWEE